MFYSLSEVIKMYDLLLFYVSVKCQYTLGEHVGFIVLRHTQATGRCGKMQVVLFEL